MLLRNNVNPLCHNWPPFFTRVWFSANRVAKIDGSNILTDNCNYISTYLVTYKLQHTLWSKKYAGYSCESLIPSNNITKFHSK